MFSVCLCAWFQAYPREFHLSVVKRISRYLKGTSNLGLSYKARDNFNLQGYCDVDYIGDKVD